jgi:hypothetical protein
LADYQVAEILEQGLVDGLRAQRVKGAPQAFEVARFEKDHALGEISPPAGADADIAGDLEFGPLDVAALVLEFLAGECQAKIEQGGPEALNSRRRRARREQRTLPFSR